MTNGEQWVSTVGKNWCTYHILALYLDKVMSLVRYFIIPLYFMLHIICCSLEKQNFSLLFSPSAGSTEMGVDS